MSLRQLKRLADGRRLFEFDLAIAHVSMIGSMLAGRFNPKYANPYRDPEDYAPPPQSPEDQERETERGFKMLEAGLRMMTRK